MNDANLTEMTCVKKKLAVHVTLQTFTFMHELGEIDEEISIGASFPVMQC